MPKTLLNLILSAMLLTCITPGAGAHIDVVFPTAKAVTINTPTTFLFGNCTKGAKFYINSQPVSLWEGNFFVHNIPLKIGKNKVTFTSVANGKTESVVYTITRNNGGASGQKPVFNDISPYPGKVMYSGVTVKENSTVRAYPSSYAERPVELPIGIKLYLSGKRGDYYRIASQGSYWIHKKNFDTVNPAQEKEYAVLSGSECLQNRDYDFFKYSLSKPVFYTITQTDEKTLVLRLFDVISEQNGNVKEFEYTFKHPLLGYEGFYEGNDFYLKVRKTPNVKTAKRPLAGIKIFVDPGHGGEEKGAQGPTRVCEKDINLNIANKLASLLEKDGAIVTYSRNDDRTVSLNDRVAQAKYDDALISISIHSNSLPNGKNPYFQHGTEVHYYRDNAKRLSEIINDNLSLDLNVRKNGVHKSSFALNRSTNPVSVLVEVAYMIHPEEYRRLRDENFRQKAAESLEKSIKQYIMEIIK